MCVRQLYNFGETVSLVFWTDTWKPESFYDKICKNRAAGLHTLCLLGETCSFGKFGTSLARPCDPTDNVPVFLLTDIKVKEQSVENMMR